MNYRKLTYSKKIYQEKNTSIGKAYNTKTYWNKNKLIRESI